jgi:hypothetical protein
VDQPIRLGDMEQTVEHFFQNRAIGSAGHAQRRQPLGIGLVAGHVLARQIIKTGDVDRLIRRETRRFRGRRSTSFSLTIPSALAILADSAMIATEKATLRRVSGSPSKTVRIASTTAESAFPAALPMAFSSFSQKDIKVSHATKRETP